MTRLRIIYTPRPDATPNADLGVLSDIYRRAIEHYEEAHYRKKKAGVTSTGGETKGLENEVRPATRILPR